jgi:hypothetical protein
MLNEKQNQLIKGIAEVVSVCEMKTMTKQILLGKLSEIAFDSNDYKVRDYINELLDGVENGY